MNSSKLSITLDFKGKDDLEQIIAKIGKKYDIPVNLDISNASLGILKDMNSSFRNLYDSARLFTTHLGLALSGAKQIYASIDSTFGSFIRSAQEQESAFISLQASLRTTGLEVDVNASKLANFASHLQKTTIYGDELLMTSMAQMQNIARFADIDTLKNATKAAIGLSSAFGIDLATAMDLVAKAAAGNTAMLSRYGIILNETASQSEKLNQVISIGSNYFAIAEDQAKSSIGSLTQLNNTWGDFQEILAEGIVPVLSQLANSMKPVIEYASAMGAEQRAITLGLIMMNALVVKQTLAIMANNAAYAALTLQQQTYIASVIATVATLKGASLGIVSFSSVMRALGASMVAAGKAFQGFLASIGPVGWIIMGITGAYFALNSVFKVNTKLIKEQMDVDKQRLEQEKDKVSGLKEEAKETVKLSERYQQLAAQTNKSSKEQNELSAIHQKLAARYPNLINSTDGFSKSLNGVKGAANEAKKAIVALGREQWKLELKLIKNQAESSKISLFDDMTRNFNWRDVWISPSRGIALESIKKDMDTMLNTDSFTQTDDYLNNLSKRWEDFGKQIDTFNKKEQIELQRGALLIKTIISYRQQYNALYKEGPQAEENSNYDTTLKDSDKSEMDSLKKEIENYRLLRKANFNEEKAEIAILKNEYAEKYKMMAGNEQAIKDLKEKEDLEIERLQKKHHDDRAGHEADHYNKLKFYAEGYYEWKKKEIEKEAANDIEGGEAWKTDQLKQLEKDRNEWKQRDIKQFEEQYNTEMGKLSELRELGVATYTEIAAKSWEYYKSLKTIIEADGEETEAEKKLLEVYLKRAQAAQLAVNRDSDLASYYNEMKFLDAAYYKWKKERIEEDVRLMDISEAQKADILKQRLKELGLQLDAFSESTRPKSLLEGLLTSLNITSEQQSKIISSFQSLASQISSIWNQLYTNLASRRDHALKDLENKAKKERKSDAWLANEKEKINAEYEKKFKNLKKTEQKMQIASATINTLEGITNALTVKPAWLAPVLAADIGALGMYQVKLIAEQKFARGGLFKGKGSTTSDSNIIAVSDHEYIMSADRVKRFGVPFFDALNFGNGEHIRKALGSIKMPQHNYPVKAMENPHDNFKSYLQNPNIAMNVTLKCDGKTLAKAVAKGNKKIIST